MRDFAQLVDRDIFAQMLLQIADALVEYRFLAGADMRGSCPLMITFLPQNPQPQHQALQKQDCFQIITRLLLVDLFNRVLQLMHQHFVDRIVQHQNLRQLQRLDKPCDFMYRLNGKMEKEKLDCVFADGTDRIKGVDRHDQQIARPDLVFLILNDNPAMSMQEEQDLEMVHENAVIDQRRLLGKPSYFKNFIIKFFFDFGEIIFLYGRIN